ncbi:hypothetical protein H4R34_000194 [Dimargaris verticillata]|uniref:Uncharacterized protein n=1 Tax=Dimargaris verticillata TaxID=2761393 RepID=A0A9W8EG45_9FUNG|nr:hypothetical protein H4R34_000194 [Dimargaris verticillata]
MWIKPTLISPVALNHSRTWQTVETTEHFYIQRRRSASDPEVRDPSAALPPYSHRLVTRGFPHYKVARGRSLAHARQHVALVVHEVLPHLPANSSSSAVAQHLRRHWATLADQAPRTLTSAATWPSRSSDSSSRHPLAGPRSQSQSLTSESSLPMSDQLPPKSTLAGPHSPENSTCSSETSSGSDYFSQPRRPFAPNTTAPVGPTGSPGPSWLALANSIPTPTLSSLRLGRPKAPRPTASSTRVSPDLRPTAALEANGATRIPGLFSFAQSCTDRLTGTAPEEHGMPPPPADGAVATDWSSMAYVWDLVALITYPEDPDDLDDHHGGPESRGDRTARKKSAQLNCYQTLKLRAQIAQRRRILLFLSLYNLVLRYCSFDLFLVLCFAANVCMLLLLKNSRKINVALAKRSVKKRIHWARTWVGGMLPWKRPRPPGNGTGTGTGGEPRPGSDDELGNPCAVSVACQAPGSLRPNAHSTPKQLSDLWVGEQSTQSDVPKHTYKSPEPGQLKPSLATSSRVSLGGGPLATRPHSSSNLGMMPFQRTQTPEPAVMG